MHGRKSTLHSVGEEVQRKTALAGSNADSLHGAEKHALSARGRNIAHSSAWEDYASHNVREKLPTLFTHGVSNPCTIKGDPRTPHFNKLPSKIEGGVQAAAIVQMAGNEQLLPTPLQLNP